MAVDIGELRGILTLQDQFSGPVNDATKQLGIFSESFGACTKAAGLAAAAITGTAGAILALGSHGSEVADVAESFDGLSKAAGSTADTMLGALRQGVVGTISDFDLMTVGAKALGAGIIKSAADMATLAEGARGLAKATGTTTAEAFDTLTRAMATGRTTALANAGLLVDTKNATLEYANSLGVSVGELTKHEKAVAGSTAILAALNARFHDQAPADFGEMLEQAKVGVQNFIDKLSVAISQSPVVLYAFKTIGEALQNAFGDKQQGAIESLTKGVGQFAIGLTYVAQGGLVAATVLVTAWYGVKTAILAVETAVVGVMTGMAAFVEGIAHLGSQIPAIGEKVQGFAAGAKDLRTELGGMTEALAQETAEAAKGVVGHSAAQEAIDKLGGGVINLRAGMEKLVGAHAAAAEGARRFGAAQQEAAVVSVDAARKIAEAQQKLEGELALIGTTGLDRKLIEIKTAHDAEILHLADLKGITKQQTAEMTAIIDEKYRREVIAAKAAGDEILQVSTKVQNEIALLQTTGLKKSTLALEQQREDDIKGLEKYRQVYGQQYDQLVLAVNQKFAILKKNLTGFYDTASQYAAANGIQTRAELQHTVDVTLAGYNQMKASGEFTDAALKASHEKYIAAVEALDGHRILSAQQGFLLLAESASTVLKSLFGKSKAAAIAAAIIDTIAAIVKTMSAYPFPWSLAPAAAAAAAGYAQVQQIRGQDAGFAEGTPGTAFLDFGRGSETTLHGEEAVVNRKQADTLSDQLANTVRNAVHAMALRASTVTVNAPINENPLQTHEGLKQLRNHSIKMLKQELGRSLARQVAMGTA